MTQKGEKVARQAADPQGKQKQRALQKKAPGKKSKKDAGSIKGEEGQGGVEGSLRRQRGNPQGSGSDRKGPGSFPANQANAIRNNYKIKKNQPPEHL
jgi:hypothetical protein